MVSCNHSNTLQLSWQTHRYQDFPACLVLTKACPAVQLPCARLQSSDESSHKGHVMQTADVAKLEAERAAEEPVSFCCTSLSLPT